MKFFENELESWLAECIQGDNYYINKFLIIPEEYEVSEDDMPEAPTAPINIFTGIEDVVIDYIRKAKWQIYIAMYLINNKKIYTELLEKKRNGVNIEIILDDNEDNHIASENVQNLNIHYVRNDTCYANKMHLKFCIVDMKTVLYGSYNYTNAANYNYESCTIDHNYSSVISYMSQFGRLRNRAA